MEERINSQKKEQSGTTQTMSLPLSSSFSFIIALHASRASNTGEGDSPLLSNMLHISKLPVGILVNVSTYLSKPSRALFALAMEISSSSSLSSSSNISKAIVSSTQWDALDFQDIEENLANKLTDDDMNEILTCINAQVVLKKLKLTGCINIEGRGLNSLRNSSVLEQIDISLAPMYGCQELSSEPKISQNIIISILDSIITTNGCILKYILFPEKWRPKSNTSSLMMQQFQDRYNQYLDGRHYKCVECNTKMDSVGWLTKDGYQNGVCYECLKPVCDKCSLEFCVICDKDYCKHCVDVENCKCPACTDIASIAFDHAISFDFARDLTDIDNDKELRKRKRDECVLM